MAGSLRGAPLNLPLFIHESVFIIIIFSHLRSSLSDKIHVKALTALTTYRIYENKTCPMVRFSLACRVLENRWSPSTLRQYMYFPSHHPHFFSFSYPLLALLTWPLWSLQTLERGTTLLFKMHCTHQRYIGSCVKKQLPGS